MHARERQVRAAMKTQPTPEAKQDSRHHTDGRWVAITRSKRALNRVVDASATKAAGTRAAEKLKGNYEGYDRRRQA